MIVTDQPQAKTAPQPARRTATLAVHGGAGGTLPPNIPIHLEKAYRDALRRSLNKGYKILADGGSALDAVCRSVQEMEDDPLFNAAKGAVFTTEGYNECEASVMVAYSPKQKHDTQAHLQRKRRCASAVLIRNTRNPILLAKALFENEKQNPHVILSGRDAELIGWRLGLKRVDDRYYYTRKRWLEHRRDLGLPDDDDLAMCRYQGEGMEGLEARTVEDPIEPPPSYYANPRTDDTFSLYSPSQDEWRTESDNEDASLKESSRSITTTEEVITPACPSTVEENNHGDLGLQYLMEWNFNTDARTYAESVQESINGDRRSEDEYDGSWLSSSFVELASPANAAQAILHRRNSNPCLDYLPQGTVGAVALDENGNLAVATSTGGVTNKLPGRIGDTPTPGAGFWAEYWKTDSAMQTMQQRQRQPQCSKERAKKRETVKGGGMTFGAPCSWVRFLFGSQAIFQEEQDEEEAIEQASNRKAGLMRANLSAREYKGVALSGTGTGDCFLRCSFASLVVHRMRFLGEGVDVASSRAVAELGELGGVGGAICIDDQGRVSFPMNSAVMNRGYVTHGHQPRVAIYANEECS
ncbi:hypothetical protein CBS101457_000644 [Exobasidium rhododendri]|nr:hypothetical protein CBS101457_000644 [Exobasidium rhododendri]